MRSSITSCNCKLHAGQACAPIEQPIPPDYGCLLIAGGHSVAAIHHSASQGNRSLAYFFSESPFRGLPLRLRSFKGVGTYICTPSSSLVPLLRKFCCSGWRLRAIVVGCSFQRGYNINLTDIYFGVITPIRCVIAR